jgi:hypothetical protein
MGPRTILDAVAKRKIPRRRRESNPEREVKVWEKLSG